VPLRPARTSLHINCAKIATIEAAKVFSAQLTLYQKHNVIAIAILFLFNQNKDKSTPIDKTVITGKNIDKTSCRGNNIISKNIFTTK
jgi:hypothetical protein